MGQLKRKQNFGVIDNTKRINRNNKELEYCPNCSRYGFNNLLEPRKYKDGELDTDKDLWRYCPECKQTIPIYQVKSTTELEAFIETEKNPFNVNRKQALGLNKKGSIKEQQSRLNKRKLKEKVKEKHYDEGGIEITDPEILLAIKQGYIINEKRPDKKLLNRR